jgi:hypothetical protein
MRLTSIILSALVLAAPVAIVAASAQPAPSGQADGQGMHGFLTPEQHAMLRMDQPQTDWHSMTPEQREAQRDQMRAKWDSMSDADKLKLKADLQAKWDALPADQKQAIEQRIAERKAHWHNQGQSQQ